MPDELIVLGSSSGVPTRLRFPAAYALTVTSKLFLIDCGAPVSTLLYRYGLDPLDVQALFLTHWHTDHVANLGLFLAQNHLLRRSRKLQVYGPRGTRGKINRLLNDSFLLLEDLSYRLKINIVKSKDTKKEALLQVKFFKTQHLEKPKHKTLYGRKATALGMVFDAPGWRILFSGDLVSPQELAAYSGGIDLLVHELAHHKPETVAEFAEASQIPCVLISHIAPQFDEIPEKIEAAFKKRYSGKLIVATDGTRVQLGQLRSRDEISEKSGTPKPAVSDAPDAFLKALQYDLGLSPELNRQILEVAKATLLKLPPSSRLPGTGKTRLEVASTSNSAEKVTVTLTLDAGEPDVELKHRDGTAALRRHRLLRIYQEAAGQGGALTQEEFAQLLNVSVRTIRRDIRFLKSDGYAVRTLGQ